MNIVICEDNLRQRKDLEYIIDEEIQNLDFRIALSTNNPNDVLKYIDEYPDNSNVFILDIDLHSNINGIELAKKIRKYDSNCYIIFLTAHAELTLLTFQYKVRALDFIFKGNLSIVQKRIHDCIAQICADISNTKNKEKNILPIDIGYEIVFIDLNDVLFFETANTEHKIRIHTSTGYYDYYGTLKETETKLSDEFYKTHRSYIVNTTKIKSIDKDNHIIHMINDEICYISTRYIKGLLQKCTSGN